MTALMDTGQDVEMVGLGAGVAGCHQGHSLWGLPPPLHNLLQRLRVGDSLQCKQDKTRQGFKYAFLLSTLILVTMSCPDIGFPESMEQDTFNTVSP